ARRYREELRNVARVNKQTLAEDALADTGPTGAGWVFELTGYYYYNSPTRIGSEGSNHVRKTLITNLMKQPIRLPDTSGQLIDFLPDELGLKYPLLLNDEKPKLVKL